MPGVNLNLDLPLLSDPMAIIVTKLVTALSVIQDDLTPQVTSGEINVNTSLSCNGNALINVGYATLAPGNIPSTAGSLYYTGGELWFVDATGAVQITENGTLNVGATGTIVGDYGGANPARVTYTTADAFYTFTVSTGVYAKLKAAAIDLVGSLGSVTLSVGTGVTSNRAMVLDALPTSGISLLTYNAGTGSISDAATAQATNDVLVTNIAATAYRHGQKFWYYPFSLFSDIIKTNSGVPGSAPSFGILNNGPVNGACDFIVRLPALRFHERLRRIVLRCSGSGTGNGTYDLLVAGANGTLLQYPLAAGGEVVTSIITTQPTFALATTYTHPSDVPGADTVSGYFLQVKWPATAVVALYSVTLTYDSID